VGWDREPTVCDNVVVVGPHGVLFAKNSDRDPNEAQSLEWHPAATHPPGAVVEATHVSVPQVATTNAVLLSRPFWMWGAEMGANEHGVVIGNEAVFTRQPYAATGLTGMDLLRLALERADDAEAAVDTIVMLLGEHGQGGRCGHEDPSFTYHNSFLVADAGGAFVLETAGAHWEVERVEEGVRAISNGLTIPHFARRHADPVRGRVAACTARRGLVEARSRRASSAEDLAATLRQHAGGGLAPRYHPVNGAMSAPCMHAGGLVAGSQTTASWVSQLTPGRARHWATATAAPCTAMFKPVRVDEPVDLTSPTDRLDDRSHWWRHERLHRRVMRDPERLLPRYSGERDEIERTWFADPPASAAAFAEADAATARWLARVPEVADGRPWYVRRYWAARDARAAIDAGALIA
jgi:secernin